MSLARADLVTAVAGELADVLTLAGIAATDTSGALKEPLDRVFRALGVAEAGLASATVADGDEQRAIAYAAYFVLSRAVGALASRVDVSLGRGEANAKESQAFAHVQEQMREALAIAQGYGLTVGKSSLAPVPYAGGISRSDYDAAEQDSDRLPPLFAVSDLRTETSERRDWTWGEAW